MQLAHRASLKGLKKSYIHNSDPQSFRSTLSLVSQVLGTERVHLNPVPEALRADGGALHPRLLNLCAAARLGCCPPGPVFVVAGRFMANPYQGNWTTRQGSTGDAQVTSNGGARLAPQLTRRPDEPLIEDRAARGGVAVRACPSIC